MIPIKTAKEIDLMKKGGEKLSRVLRQTLQAVRPGVSLKKLEHLAELLIKKEDGQPSFKMVKDYHWTTCLNVNQGVVHGIPSDYRLKEGDLLSLDIGIFYQGLHTDMARTVEVRSGKDEVRSGKFLETGKTALRQAIQAARPGNRVGHISQAIETEIKKAGFQPIRVLTGHGVGKQLHEPPAIPCFLKGLLSSTPRLEENMVLAIEVIYAQNQPEIVVKEDGWTIETADGRSAALFEDTVAITRTGPEALTA